MSGTSLRIRINLLTGYIPRSSVNYALAETARPIVGKYSRAGACRPNQRKIQHFCCANYVLLVRHGVPLVFFAVALRTLILRTCAHCRKDFLGVLRTPF